MSYLMIRNPGVADHRGFTLLGVSTTRNLGYSGTIGQFGSGSKLSIALLLRHGISPIVACGNLKLTFDIKKEIVKDQIFRRVVVKYSGTDVDGVTKNSTEDLGFTLEWGVQDWKQLSMAFREFVSNAIDGSIVAGGSFKSIKFEIVEQPRAKAGYTSVFLPLTPEIEAIYSQLAALFLHFRNPKLLDCKCLPKFDPDVKCALIYKKGVLVSRSKNNSVFDYNLGDELTLDESRNANEWDVKYAVAKAIRKESAENLAYLIKRIQENPDVWEAHLDGGYLEPDCNDDLEERKKVFASAWRCIAGPKGVATTGSLALDSFILQKGFVPVKMPHGWMKALELYDVATENTVLSQNELDGKVISEATPEMIECTKRVWNFLETFKMTNGKALPEVKAFMSIMDGSAQTLGYYVPGGKEIYLHSSLGVGKMMFKVALEECVHYATGSTDGSRDLQDFLFNLVTEMAA